MDQAPNRLLPRLVRSYWQAESTSKVGAFFFTRVANVQCGSESADHRPLDREAVCSTPAGGAQPHTRMGGKKSKPTHETEQKRIPQTGGDRGWPEGEQKRPSMLSPAAARQLQEMSISVASRAETIWIRLLTVYCPD